MDITCSSLSSKIQINFKFCNIQPKDSVDSGCLGYNIWLFELICGLRTDLWRGVKILERQRIKFVFPCLIRWFHLPSMLIVVGKEECVLKYM